MKMERVQNSTFAASAGGGITAIILWAVQKWGGVGAEEIPPEIAAAITAIVMAVLTHFIPDATQPTAGTGAAGTAGGAAGTAAHGVAAGG
jgi:hypothetical protein